MYIVCSSNLQNLKSVDLHFGTDISYYPRCIHWPNIIPLPLVVTGICTLTETLSRSSANCRSRWSNLGLDVGYCSRCIHWPNPSTTCSCRDMHLNRNFNLSCSSIKCKSKWPNFSTDVGYYPRCIDWPNIIPLPLVVAEICTLTKTLIWLLLKYACTY